MLSHLRTLWAVFTHTVARRETLLAALREVPPKQRAVLVLRYFDGLDVAATDDKSIDLFVFTEREGALGAVGHDLKLRVGELTLNRDGDQVLVSVKADSLRVEACIVQGDEKPVSLVDRKVIERNLDDQSNRKLVESFLATVQVGITVIGAMGTKVIARWSSVNSSM